MSVQSPAPTEHGILRFLEVCDTFYPPDSVDSPIEIQRARYNALCSHFEGPLTQWPDFADGLVQRVPIRRYRPVSRRTDTVLLYLHGGGFVVGSLNSHHSICAEVANFVGAALISVDYRLAPEHRWPSATDDCYAVLTHLLASGLRVVLIGDSAGGTLAAGLALRASEHDLAGIDGQVLIYPALGGDLKTGSYVDMAEARGLTTADVAYYRKTMQAPDGDAIAYPLRSHSLAGLPPAFITAAHFDPLRDDGRQYSARLIEAGVSVQFREEPQMVHGWLRARYISEGADAGFRAVCEAVGRFACS